MRGTVFRAVGEEGKEGGEEGRTEQEGGQQKASGPEKLRYDIRSAMAILV